MRDLAILFCACMLTAQVGMADFPMSEPVDATTTTTLATPQANLSPEQIDSLVAPIALYPDELVSQILVASTYPLEVVQAYQWIQQHPELKGQELTQAAQQQNWDPSIQALVAFPDVLKRLNQDVTWTTNLGNAFLANQTTVMDEIQSMRAKADAAGKLTSTPQQTVTHTTENGQTIVKIEPASPDVIYVPDYNPVWIWGPAPIYYHYPYWYYPPAPPVGFWCWWGPRIYLGGYFAGWGGWAGWGWHPHWYSRTVVVNRTFVTVNHFNTIRAVDVRGRSVWQHNPEHRIGVAYPNRTLTRDYHPVGRAAFPHVSVIQAREQFRAAGGRIQTDRFGHRQVAPGVFNRNHTAFGGVETGGAARAHSSRGNTSLGHAHDSGDASGGSHEGSGGHGSSGGHGGWSGHSGGGHR